MSVCTFMLICARQSFYYKILLVLCVLKIVKVYEHAKQCAVYHNAFDQKKSTVILEYCNMLKNDIFCLVGVSVQGTSVLQYSETAFHIYCQLLYSTRMLPFSKKN